MRQPFSILARKNIFIVVDSLERLLSYRIFKSFHRLRIWDFVNMQRRTRFWPTFSAIFLPPFLLLLPLKFRQNYVIFNVFSGVLNRSVKINHTCNYTYESFKEKRKFHSYNQREKKN